MEINAIFRINVTIGVIPHTPLLIVFFANENYGLKNK